MDNYLREHKHQEGSFLIGHIMGNEWQMVKDGKFYSANVDPDGRSVCLKAISNNDNIEDHEMLKKKFAAIIKSEIYNSIFAAERLAKEAGYKDFKINEDEMMEMLNLKTYALFEDSIN